MDLLDEGGLSAQGTLQAAFIFLELRFRDFAVADIHHDDPTVRTFRFLSLHHLEPRPEQRAIALVHPHLTDLREARFQQAFTV